GRSGLHPHHREAVHLHRGSDAGAEVSSRVRRLFRKGAPLALGSLGPPNKRMKLTGGPPYWFRAACSSCRRPRQLILIVVRGLMTRAGADKWLGQIVEINGRYHHENEILKRLAEEDN